MLRRHHKTTHRHGMTIGAMAITLAASLIWPRAIAGTLPQAGAPSCSASAESSRRVELSDGRIVSVDVQSVAVSNGAVMALGRNAYVFPRDANSRTSPGLKDSIIGFVIDGRGNASLVHRPLRDRRVFHPRAASGPNGSFHVLFATGIDTSDAAPITADTASIWYARFTRGEWSAPEHVADVRDAALLPEHASDLLERDGSLNFLFPFADVKGTESGGGVILLRRRARGWFADTLRTLLPPTAVRALHGSRGQSLVVLLAESVPISGPRAEELFLVRFDSAWSEPRRLAGDGVRPVSLPIAAAVGNDILASWLSWRTTLPETSVVEWFRIHPDGRLTSGPVIDSGERTFPFEMIVVDDRYPLWLYRGGSYGTTLTLAMATDSSAASLGTLTVPFHNPRARAIALSGTRVLVFTMKRAVINAEPMIASYMTAIEFRCPRSERR